MSDALLNVIRLEDVTSKLISVSWTGITLDQQIQYKVKLASNSNTTQIETSATKAVFSDLTPGTIYTLIIEYLSCDIKKNISRDIITAGKVYESSTRIPGREFLSDYSNQSSKLYKDFVANFTMQVENNLPKAYQDLTRAKEMVVVVTGVHRGSVIVDFDLVIALEVKLSTSDVQNSVINALKLSALGVDLNFTSVKEADVCQRGDYTCSKNASCVREGPSHSCECKAGFYDENPTVPGTDCKRNISPGADPCKGLCSSCAQCVVGPGGSHECSCYPGLIDQNPVNPGKLCKDPVDCFDQEKDICSSQNLCLPSKFLCSLRNVFKLTAEFNSWIFNSSLHDPGSDAWAYASTKIIKTVVPRMRCVLSDSSFDMTVVGFQRGSVVVRMMCGYNGNTTADERTLQAALQDTIRKHLDNSAKATLKRVSQISMAPGAGWKVATIVLGVLLGFTLTVVVVVLIITIARRAASKLTSYNIEQTKHNRQVVSDDYVEGRYSYQV